MLAKQHAPTRLAGMGTGGSRTAQPSAGRKTASWVCDGIIVKIMSPALKSAGYYKQKGAVTRVIDGYVAEIELLDSGVPGVYSRVHVREKGGGLEGPVYASSVRPWTT